MHITNNIMLTIWKGLRPPGIKLMLPENPAVMGKRIHMRRPSFPKKIKVNIPKQRPITKKGSLGAIKTPRSTAPKKRPVWIKILRMSSLVTVYIFRYFHMKSKTSC
jgi:hypothetical protein